MTDGELLARAAKAAGFPAGYEPSLGRSWNPLTDDGDALRLAVKLGIVIEYRREVPACFAYQYATALEVMQRNEGLDPNAATRRAVVRAAAALAPT